MLVRHKLKTSLFWNVNQIENKIEMNKTINARESVLYFNTFSKRDNRVEYFLI